MATVMRQREKVIREARTRFYPGWWVYNWDQADESLRPIYRVVCRTPDEFGLANRVKPDNVRARILFVPDARFEKERIPFEVLVSKLGVEPEKIRRWIDEGQVALAYASEHATFTNTQLKEFLGCKLREELEELFSDSNAWMNAPNPRFGGASPKEMIAGGGIEAVIEAVEAIKHGMVT